MPKKKKQLIASTSGIRGVIGNGLDPVAVVTYGAAFGTLLKEGTVVIGSDSRPSGEMVKRAVIAGLTSVGIDVMDLGIVPTPTVEIAVNRHRAVGGICVTASHNPADWNALKFFNSRGEFITASQFKTLNKILTERRFSYKSSDRLGQVSHQHSGIRDHVKRTLALKVLNRTGIKARKFKVAVDAINGAGSVALPMLLDELGASVVRINCKGDGNFVHEPEPIPGNLRQLGNIVRKHKADIGMACDPDADRLALVDETGKAIGEELTLTIAVKEVLRKMSGATVINLSTSKVTADIARAAGSQVYYSKVGESNVVTMMHKKKSVIGGEGNGGVIFPLFHAGRDSLVAAALVLSALATEKCSLADLVETFPKYYNIKSKASLPDDFDVRLKRFEQEATGLFGDVKADHRDGLRLDFSDGWVQLRKSNTEPIYRLIVETDRQKLTGSLYRKVRTYLK